MLPRADRATNQILESPSARSRHVPNHYRNSYHNRVAAKHRVFSRAAGKISVHVNAWWTASFLSSTVLALRILFQKFDCVTHGLNIFCDIVGNFAPEPFFKRDNQLDGIKAIGS